MIIRIARTNRSNGRKAKVDGCFQLLAFVCICAFVSPNGMTWQKKKHFTKCMTIRMINTTTYYCICIYIQYIVNYNYSYS